MSFLTFFLIKKNLYFENVKPKILKITRIKVIGKKITSKSSFKKVSL